MSRFLQRCLIAACLVCCTSCFPRTFLTSDCPKPSYQRIVQVLSSAAIREGMTITASDPATGMFQATKTSTMLGTRQTYRWSVTIEGRDLVAAAVATTETLNVFGAVTGSAEMFYNDNVAKDHYWYWTVRNEIEKLCGSPITFKQQ